MSQKDIHVCLYMSVAFGGSEKIRTVLCDTLYGVRSRLKEYYDDFLCAVSTCYMYVHPTFWSQLMRK